MNEQLTLIDLADQTFYDTIQNIINNIISDLDLPNDSIFLYSNTSNKGNNVGKETSKSICLYEPEYPSTGKSNTKPGKNDIVLRIADLKDDFIDIVVRLLQSKQITIPDSAEIKSRKSDAGFVHIIMPKSDSQLPAFVRENILYCLNNYKSHDSFGCCSKYLACSDAKKCLHENKMYAMKCNYRANLETGKIFYGENKIF